MSSVESPTNRALRRATSIARILRTAGTLCCLQPVAAVAQVVRGIVVEEASGQPVPGVVIVLLDSTGKRITGVLAGDDGRYALRAVAPGRFAVRAERIGFRAAAPTEVTLHSGEAVELRLVTRPIPVVLSEVRVTGRTPCVARAADGREVSAVWDEARKALYATDLTQREEMFSARVSRFQRTLDARTGQVTAYETKEGRGVTRNPFVSLPAARLSAEGFVRQGEDETIYYGPDAGVLLSDEFLGDHCFRLRAGEGGRAQLIGLEFEPVRGREMADIAGTLWLDRSSAELRDLEYVYRNLPNLPSTVKSEDFGGHIEFHRMPTGAWIVERWVIRMPIVASNGPLARPIVAPIPGMGATPVERVRLAAVREEGGEVMETVARGARRESAADRATVRGVVFDSTRMAPLSDARVFLDGTQFNARSGADGSFVIGEVPAGTYSLSVVHPRFDSLAIRPPAETMALRVGEENIAHLAGPSTETILARDCTSEERARGPASLRGRVGDATGGGPAVDAQVFVTWNRLTTTSGSVVPVSEQRAGTRTDSTGRYDLCGLPEDVRLTVRAVTSERRSAPVQLTLPGGQVSVLDFALGTGVVAAAAEPEAVMPVIVRSAPNEGMRAVERRRRRGAGSYLVRPQIEKLHATRITDLLRTMPGVAVRPDESGGLTVELRGAPRLTAGGQPATRTDSAGRAAGQAPPNTVSALDTERRCPAGFRVDGLPVPGGGGIDSDVRPEDIEAIEVYSAGQVPVEFSGRSAACGVVLIWTRGFADRPGRPAPKRDGGR